MFKEFKEFVTRGNVVDLAVAFIMGASFGKIVTSLVEDIIMPPIGMLLKNVDFSNLFVTLSGETFENLAAAKKAGAPALAYGMFLNTVINFVIVAFAVFLLVKQVKRFTAKPAPAAEPAPATRECPFCLSKVPLKATRCAACTSTLSPEAAIDATSH